MHDSPIEAQPPPTPPHRQRQRGYLLGLLGVLLVTPDAVLVRVASEQFGGTFWWIVATKCAFLAVMMIAIAVARHGVRRQLAGLRTGPGHIALVTLCQGLVTTGFPVCFQTTTTARALLFISLNPLWAAVLGRVVLGEVLPRRTMLALIGAALSVGCLVFPPIALGEDAGVAVAADGVGNWRGDCISLATGAALASLITASRLTAKRRPRAPVELGVALGSVAAAVATFAVAGSVEGGAGAFAPPFWPLMVADAAAVAAVSLLALTIAPRYISPAEVALLLLLENIGGPLWVAIAGYETPRVWTFIGGGLLLSVLGVHQACAFCAGQREAREACAGQGGAVDQTDLVPVVSAAA